jgi:hypothetical protein
MEKGIIHRASSGIGCSNDKGRSQALHPDLTIMEKCVFHRASSGVGCSNDKGWSRVLHPDLSNAACLPAKRGYSHEFMLQWDSTVICTLQFELKVFTQCIYQAIRRNKFINWCNKKQQEKEVDFNAIFFTLRAK